MLKKNTSTVLIRWLACLWLLFLPANGYIPKSLFFGNNNRSPIVARPRKHRYMVVDESSRGSVLFSSEKNGGGASSYRVIDRETTTASTVDRQKTTRHRQHRQKGGLKKVVVAIEKKSSNDANNIREAINRNKKIMALGKQRRWKEILELVSEEKDRLNNVNWSTAFVQLSKIRTPDRRDPLFAHCLDYYSSALDGWGLEWAGTREIANIVYTIGKTRLRTRAAKRILEFVTRPANAREIVRHGNTQEVANICWSLARVGGYPSDAVDAPLFFREVERRAAWLVEDGSTQHVANTAWASATLGVRLPKLFSEIEKRAGWLVGEGSNQGIANTAWACAKLGVPSPGLFSEIEKHAERLTRDGGTQEVANTAWAFATLGVPSPALFSEIERVAAGRLLREGKRQEVANTAWAFARVDYQSTKLFSKIEEHSDWVLADGSTQHVSNTLWAASHFHYYPPMLLQKANARGEWLVREGNTQAISNVALVFAVYGYYADAFFAAVAASDGISKLEKHGNAQDLINLCHAIVVLNIGKRYNDALVRMWRAATNLDPETIPTEGLRQLAQVFAYSKADGIELEPPSDALASKIQNAVQFPESQKSKYQEEILRLLQQTGLDFEEDVSPFLGGWNQRLDNGMLSINIACTSHMVAIEYNGLSHFLKDVGTGEVTRRETGATKAKRLFLRQMGWSVIDIDYRDWLEAKKKDCRSEFLHEKLRKAGVQQPTTYNDGAKPGDDATTQKATTATMVQLSKLRKNDHSFDLDAELTARGISLEHSDKHPDPIKAGQPKLWTEKKEDIKLNEALVRGSESNYDKRFFEKQSTAAFCIPPPTTREERSQG